MKIFNKIAMAVLLAATTIVGTGCREENPPMISANPENIQIGIEAQSIPVQVRSNSHWTATVSQGSDWCALSISQGYGTETLYVNVMYYNDDPTPRTAIINLATTGHNSVTAQIMVVQSAANSTLMISPENINIDKAAQTVGMAIASNNNWEISVDKASLVGVLSQTSGAGNATIDIPVMENLSHETRVITVTVTAGTGTRAVQKTMTITQSGVGAPSLFVSETSLSFPQPGGTADVVVITNIQGDIQATSDFAWCQATVDNSTKIITITCTPNDNNAARYAIVTVIGQVNGVAVTQQIRVTQAGVGSPQITLLSNNVQVIDDGQTGVMIGYIKANTGITVTVAGGYPSWISNISQNETGVNGTITFDVAKNSDMAMRQGVINLVASVGNESLVYPVNVIQAGVGVMELLLIPNYVNVTAATTAELVTGFISKASATVTAIISDGPTGMITGLTNSVTVAADGSFTIPFTVSDNNGYATRTATIIITAREGTQTVIGTISIIQAGIGAPNVVVVSDAITIPQAGANTGDGYGTQLIGTVAATQIAPVTIGGFTATPQGSPFNFIEITAPANNAASSRTQTINMVVQQGGATQVIVLNITQLGTGDPILKIPQTSFTFPAAGLTGFDIAVIPVNGTTYTVVSKPTFITTATVGANVLTVDVAPNLTADELSGTITLMAQIGASGTDIAFYTIGVVQKGVEAPALSLAATEVWLAADQTAISVPVIGDAAGCTFTKFIPNAWITNAVFGTGSLDLTIDANTSAASRSQEISAIFTRAGQSQTLHLKVNQAGTGAPNVIPGATSLVFGPAAETGVSVYLLNEATEATVTVKSKPSWITNAAISAANDELTFDVAQNNTTSVRSGNIVLEASKGGVKTMISIAVSQSAQAPLAASLSMASTSVSSAATVTGQETNVLIKNLPAGATVTSPIHSSNTWLSGAVTGNQLAVTVQANLVGEPRTGVLTLEITDGTTGEVQYLTLVVNQAAITVANLLAATTGIHFTDAAPAAIDVELQGYNATDYTIQLQTSAGWIHPTFAAPNVSTTADANTSASARTGSITVKVTKIDGTVQNIRLNVTQDGVATASVAPVPDIVPLYSSVLLPYTAGNNVTDFVAVGANPFNASLYNNIQLTANDPWIGIAYTMSPFEMHVWALSANTSASPRTGSFTIRISKTDGTQQVINATVTQEGTITASSPAIPDIVPYTTDVNLLSIQGDNVTNFVAVGANPFNAADYTNIQTTTHNSWIEVDYTMSPFELHIWAKWGNASTSPRTGTFTLIITKADGTKQTINATVTQQGALTLTPPPVPVIPDIVPTYTGVSLLKWAGSNSTNNVTIGANPFNAADYTNIQVSASQSWVGYDVAMSPTFTINIWANTMNNSGAQRTATITLIVTKADGTKQTITGTVTQEG